MRALRGRRRAAALRVIGELEDRGCEAAGYRLAGTGLDHVCCRHLADNDRMLTVWPDENRVVILVGPHDGTPGDVYGRLLDALGVGVPTDERTKPACCGNGEPPPVDARGAAAIADAVERAARARPS